MAEESIASKKNAYSMRSFLFKPHYMILGIIIVSLIVIWARIIMQDSERSVPNFEIHQEKEPRNVIESPTKLKIWSSDFHISPIADLKHFFKRFNVEIIDKSLSGHCHLTKSCATDLHVINKENGIALSPCPNELRRDFYNHYINDPEFQSVDAVLCLHATSMCELFMPFGKPLIAITSTRYEIGRHDKVRWRTWNENLLRIAQKEENTVGANNRYDQEYIKYFVPLREVEYLPNLCQYVAVKYNPTKPTLFLLAPSRGIHPQLTRALGEALREFRLSESSSSSHFDLVPIRELYPHFEYADLVQHPAIVVLPYQVSFMSFFEFYQMEVPLLVPSLAFLADYQLRHQVLSERTWHQVLTGEPGRGSPLPRHANSSAALGSDPNDDTSPEALRDWLGLADFYRFPHVLQFSSWRELFSLLSGLSPESWRAISRRMKSFNEQLEASQTDKWTRILQKVQRAKERRQQHQQEGANHQQRQQQGWEGVNRALSSLYGYQLHPADCQSQTPPPLLRVRSGQTGWAWGGSKGGDEEEGV